MGLGVVGLAENKANSAQLELELGLSLAKSRFKGYVVLYVMETFLPYLGVSTICFVLVALLVKQVNSCLESWPRTRTRV